MSRYCHTDHCHDCICRRVADKLEIVEEISDPPNHVAERRELIELMSQRSRMKEDAQRMGVA